MIPMIKLCFILNVSNRLTFSVPFSVCVSLYLESGIFFALSLSCLFIVRSTQMDFDYFFSVLFSIKIGLMVRH